MGKKNISSTELTPEEMTELDKFTGSMAPQQVKDFTLLVQHNDLIILKDSAGVSFAVEYTLNGVRLKELG